MMNKKLLALFVAIATVSTSVFALFDEVAGGTFRTAERVATVPVDATGAAIDRDETYSERREKRRQDREFDKEQREANREEKYRARYYD